MLQFCTKNVYKNTYFRLVLIWFRETGVLNEALEMKKIRVELTK